ncbi:MAG: GDP-L-fucose synthase [Planctomycetota bacterium]|jgi:GDP-L-fucose synthase
MTRYLITGAHGFIGKHLTDFIRKNELDSDVVPVGREYDLTDSTACMKLLQESESFDYIFHLADVSGNARWSASHSADQFFANAKMSLNILEGVCKFQPHARLVGFSSLWAYPARVALAREQDYWDGPLHELIQHYGLNKKFLGGGLQACKQQLRINGTMLVLGSVYGPGDYSDHVIPSLIQRMKDNPNMLEVWGSGRQVRDFIYVEDQVHSIYLHRDFNGNLLNISGCGSYSIRNVVEALTKLLPYNGKIVYISEADAREDERRMDMTLAAQETGWPVNYKLRSLEEGLLLTLRGIH